MPQARHKPSRLHSNRAADAAWRASQAHVDADIEGIARDPEADRLVAEMEAAGIGPERRIERLKAYFMSRRDGKPAKGRE